MTILAYLNLLPKAYKNSSKAILMDETFFNQNKKLWDKKVEVHLKSAFYGLEQFKAGKSSLNEIDAAAFSDVKGKSLLHLQCHFGQDTLSFAREGAAVTGVDFSEKAIEAAQNLSRELGLDSRFIVANVYDVPKLLPERFDMVFTGFGAIPWLPDLDKWASVVAACLKPGAEFFIAEFHPTLYLFNFDSRKPEYHYFNTGKPYEETIQGTYADPRASIEEKEYFWNHSLEEVVMALLNNGLQLVAFREYDFSPYNCFPNMIEREPGRYVFDINGLRIPHVFSLKMVL